MISAKDIEFHVTDHALGVDVVANVVLGASHRIDRSFLISDVDVMDAAKRDMAHSLWRRLYGQAYDWAFKARAAILLLSRPPASEEIDREVMALVEALSPANFLKAPNTAAPPMQEGQRQSEGPRGNVSFVGFDAAYPDSDVSVSSPYMTTAMPPDRLVENDAGQGRIP